MTKMRPFRKIEGNKDMDVGVRPHPAKVLGEQVRLMQVAKGHTDADAATALDVRWGTDVRIIRGVCDHRQHLPAISSYLETPLQVLEMRLANQSDGEKQIVAEKMERSLVSYRAMHERGHQRRAINRRALERMKAEEGWNAKSR